MNAQKIAERGLLPQFIIRHAIRNRIAKQLDEETKTFDKDALIKELSNSPIAHSCDSANEQHYELPPAFFKLILGKCLKYSACLWEEGTQTLDQAEQASLKLIAKRAELKDGMSILELGCGWGSFTLWAAKAYPNGQITAVSNSSFQREYIEEKAKNQGLSNITVITADMNCFQAEPSFERVVSIEMFEHMSNYEILLKRISNWLTEDGKLFVHIFTHRDIAYKYKIRSEKDWMSKYFFTGGIMPSRSLLGAFNKHLNIEKQWDINGIHYSRTLEAWLLHMKENKQEIIKIFNKHYPKNQVNCWYYRWQLFTIACSELFAYRGGEEWGVSHYLFNKNINKD